MSSNKYLAILILCFFSYLGKAEFPPSRDTEFQIRMNHRARFFNWRNGIQDRKGLSPLALASGIGAISGALTYAVTGDIATSLQAGIGTPTGLLVLGNALLPMDKNSWLLGDIYAGLRNISIQAALRSKGLYLNAKLSCQR